VTRPLSVVARPVPSKDRLRATVKEIARLIDALPEPMCVALEKSNVLGALRSQLESLGAVGGALGGAGQIVGGAVDLARKVAELRKILRV
jgi:hypothetical protein